MVLTTVKDTVTSTIDLSQEVRLWGNPGISAKIEFGRQAGYPRNG